MSGIMQQKLVQDYLKADAVDTAIISYQVPMDTGVNILDRLIIKLYADIKILDEQKYKELKPKADQYINEYKKQESDVRKRHEEETKANDPHNEKSLNDRLCRLKHISQQGILTEIQNIAYRKGWLD